MTVNDEPAQFAVAAVVRPGQAPAGLGARGILRPLLRKPARHHQGREARDLVRPFTKPGGAAEIPLEGHVIAACSRA